MGENMREVTINALRDAIKVFERAGVPHLIIVGIPSSSESLASYAFDGSKGATYMVRNAFKKLMTQIEKEQSSSEEHDDDDDEDWDDDEDEDEDEDDDAYPTDHSFAYREAMKLKEAFKEANNEAMKSCSNFARVPGADHAILEILENTKLFLRDCIKSGRKDKLKEIMQFSQDVFTKAMTAERVSAKVFNNLVLIKDSMESVDLSGGFQHAYVEGVVALVDLTKERLKEELRGNS